MIRSKYRISLDLHDTTSQASIRIVEGDTSRKIIFNFTEDGKPYSLTEDCYAVLAATKPDGTKIFNDTVNRLDSVEYDVTSQTVSAEGMVHCQLWIYGKDGENIASPLFTILVTQKVFDNSVVESTDEFSALQTLIEETTNIKASEEGRVEAEKTRAQSESSRLANESIRISNEQTRTSAEAVRVSNETKREQAYTEVTEAEALRASAEAARIQNEETRITNEAERERAVTELLTQSTAVQLNSRIDRCDKRITNLEKGIPSEQFVTDSSVAHTKYVPANALPYAEVGMIGGMTYKDGDTLKSAPVTDGKSVGANIFGGDALADRLVEVAGAVKDEATGLVRFYAGSVGEQLIFDGFKPNTQYTFILNGWNEYGAGTNLMISYTDDTVDYLPFPYSQALGTSVFKSQSGKTIKGLYGVMYASYTNLYYDKCGVFEGAITAEEFKPYREEVLPIPEAVRNLDGYGWGVKDTCCNYIDLVKKLFVKRVGCVDMGTLYWWFSDAAFSCDISGLKFAAYGVNPNMITLSYNVVGATGSTALPNLADNTITTNYTLSRVYVKDSTYTDANAFKSAMSGVMLYYELAEPIITDISDILPSDNFIGVEGKGTLTFNNEYKYAVPSEVSYQLKEA